MVAPSAQGLRGLDREVSYLKVILRTGSQKAAAHELQVRPQHVKNTMTSLYRRLGVGGMPQAVYIIWLKDSWGE